jgi:GT2 family glycosyltransferase
MEPITIIVNLRDKFSTTESCLESLIAHSVMPHELIIVAGGVPEPLRTRWRRLFENQARFVFEDSFLNQAQSRNIGLRMTRTSCVVFIDNDVYVRPGWLEALVRCQSDTGAAMVVPLVLETETLIHTAGNDLYVTFEKGKAFGQKQLRFHGKSLIERANLKRQPIDYGEMHCQLMQTEATLRIGGFDEEMREVGEVDCGLSLAKAGYEMWSEPASVVFFHLDAPIKAEDIGSFTWRWDMRAILEGYRYFENKWNLDITECGRFKDFLLETNSRVGMVARKFPSDFGLTCDRWLEAFYSFITLPYRQMDWWIRKYKGRQFGYFEWPN